MSDKKYLIDTSVVPVALGDSTPKHLVAFNDAASDGKLHTSVYVRMEVIRRWVCDFIAMASIVRQCTSIEMAWHYLSQDFGTRRLKTGFFALGAAWNTLRKAKTPKQLSEEFTHLAFGVLRKFDRRLPSKTQNATNCQIGGKQM